MRETEIIERIRTLAQKNHRDQALKLGIGDDCAVLRPRVKEDLVFTSDFVLEDRHFTLRTHSPAAIGEKALARSLSDLAAMGAEPVFCLVSLAVPAKLNGPFVRAFLSRISADRQSLFHFVGRWRPGPLRQSDCRCNLLRPGPARESTVARQRQAGAANFVTGKLGAAAHAFAAGRPILPVPRLEAGVALRKLGVSAAIDLSDGLSLDLARLCHESNVSADIFSKRLPLRRTPPSMKRSTAVKTTNCSSPLRRNSRFLARLANWRFARLA